MTANRNNPSLSGSVFLCLFGIIWFSIATHWTVQQQFRWGKGGNSTIVNPENHPIFFCCWLAFCFGVGIFSFVLGIIELRALFRQRRNERKKIREDKY